MIFSFFFFRLRVRFDRLNEHVYASPGVWRIHAVSYMHYSTVGTAVGVAVGLAVSLLFPDRRPVDPALLTPCARRFVAAAGRGPVRPRSEAEEYAPVSRDAAATTEL